MDTMSDKTRLFCLYSKAEPSDRVLKLISDGDEEIYVSAKTVRDVAVFTNKRILICDTQGITGKKIEYFSIPYKSIVTYSVETAGTLDTNCELRLTLSNDVVIELRFMRTKQMEELIFDAHDIISRFLLG